MTYLSGVKIRCVAALALLAAVAHAKPAPKAKAIIADDKLAAAIAPLHERYTVGDTRLGKAQGFDREGQGWSARLSSSDLGPIEIAIFLPVRDGAIASAAPLLRDADELVRRIRFLPWLLRYFAVVRTHVTMYYFGEHSLAPSLKAEIVARMKKTQTPERREAIGAQLDRSVVFEVAGSTFVALPDGTTFVYAVGAPPVLKDIKVDEVVDGDGNAVP